MITTQAIQEQLKRILVSADFDASERNRRFLAFVVEMVISGRADRIKAYTIATDVFGRAKNFDPQLDSIVRIEAGRLRRSLEHYYLTAGVGDSIKIFIPKGTYAPTFEHASEAAPLRSRDDARKLNLYGPVVAVHAFESAEHQGDSRGLTSSLVRQLVVGLTRFGGIYVVKSVDHGRSMTTKNIHSGTRPDFVLSGNANRNREGIYVDAVLMDTTSIEYIWAEQYERLCKTEEILSNSEEIANKIVYAIAQPHGAIFRHYVRHLEGRLPSELSPYDSVILFRKYTQSYARELVVPVFTALQATVTNSPEYAEAHACLSRLYVDIHRFQFDALVAVDDPLCNALRYGRMAVGMAPDASSSHHALAATYWFRGEVQASLDAYRTALELNPNDAELLAETAVRYAAIAQWDEALRLLDSSYERNPIQSSTFRVALSFCHLAQGRYAEALAEARKAIAPDVPYGHMLVAVAAINLGYRDEARLAIEAILKIDPKYGERAIADLTQRNVHPSMIRIIAKGLAKAGIAVDLSGLGLHEVQDNAIAKIAANRPL